ncbi:hypothetical protein [uncultured Anaerovibrio sp.]|jgi:hypothetical protein|uniref:hypothetical protein n=1 Tax=uncultured Anaerovibrio sp. TaxID=361586 RepID=UPI0026227481|nr:hypothetical protein [uncultured Anaerovibrio sp.]
MAEEEKQQEQTAEAMGILYGRKWLIQIYKPAYKENENGEKERDTENDTAIDVSDLRCIFNVKKDVNSFITIGTLVIYNLTAETEKGIIEEGFQISIFAGYEQGQYGEIFTGDIVQVIRNREDGINYKLEILAAHAIKEFSWNFIRSSVAANSTARQRAEEACKQADTPIEVDEISENIPDQPLPRGKIFFGKPFKYLRDIAIHNNAFFELNSGEKVSMHGLNDEIPENMCIEVAPESGLVGTPKYTDNGIIIKTLLDPRIKPWTLVKINNEIIQRTLINIDPQMKTSQGTNGTEKASNEQKNQKTMFDEDGEYAALSVTYQGDTWGDEWSTEIVGLSRNGRSGLFTAISQADQSVQA